MGKESTTLTPRNITLPIARFLSADEKAKYNRIIDEKYFSKNARNILKEPSNLFKVIELQNQRVNVADLSDLGNITEQKRDLIPRFCIDVPVVVLRRIGNSCRSSDFLARDLANQIGKEYLRNSLIVTNLGLEESEESIYGLKFKTTYKTEVYDVPELNHKKDKKTFSKTDERGIPILDKKGKRNLYTGDSSFSRLYLNKERGLDSTLINLAYSVPDCRVVVVDKD